MNKSKNRIVNGAFGVAIRPDFSILLSQRNQPANPKAHLKWQLPGGGQEYGESLIESLHRELKEELGLTDVSILDSVPQIHFSLWEDENCMTHVNLFIYRIDIHDQTPKISDDESVDWKWFSLDEISNLKTLPGTLEFVTKALQQHTQSSTT